MKNKLKYIIHITSYYPPHLGGMENCVQEISKKQAEKGYKVKVFTSNIGAEDRKRRDTKNHQVFYLKSREFAHTPLIPSLFFKLLQIPKQSIMHIHISQAFTPEIVFLISKLKKIPYIAHIHLDVDPSGSFGFLLRPYKKFFLTPVLQSASQIICLSESQKEAIAKKYSLPKEKIAVVSNGVSKAFFVERIVTKKEVPTILFVGRLTSQKNVPRLIEAAALMKEKALIKIVGEGEDREEIERLITKLSLTNITLLGKKTGEELRELYKTSDIFVLTSKREGIPLAMLEAMAAALPIVASDIEGVRDLLGNTGILVSNITAEGFASEIDRLIRDNDLQKELSRKTSLRAKRYTWGHIVSKISTLYDKVITNEKNKPAFFKKPKLQFSFSPLIVFLSKIRSKETFTRTITQTFLRKEKLFALFKENIVLARIITLACLTNILLLTDTNPFFLRDILSFVLLFLVPGILIMQLLRIQFVRFWEYIAFVVGLSLSFLLLTGLFINQTLPIFGINQPLAEIPVVISIDILLTLLTYAVYKWNRFFVFPLPVIRRERYNLTFLFSLFLFPLLAIFGAVSLNNGGTSIFDEFLLGGIGVYVLALILFRHKVSPVIFPTSLFSIGLSLLFTTSLRSWYIAGHDVQLEYYVFQLTKLHHYWSINYYKDAYNACLSISLLPTMLTDFFHFSDFYIYKLIFQILFALCPVMMYLFLRTYTTRVLAFLSSFYFLAFPTFYNDMPMLNRQEIGFLFFSLVLLVGFSSSVPKWTRTLLFLLFGFSVIISHYSTNYVLLFIFLCSYGMSKILSFKKTQALLEKLFRVIHITPQSRIIENKFLNVFLLISLFGLTIFWNTIFTKTSNNISTVAQKIASSIFISSPQDAKSTDTAYTLFFSHKTDQKKILNDFIQTNIQQAEKLHEADFYSKKDYQNYPASPIAQMVAPLTPVGKFFEGLHLPLFTIYSLSRSLAAKIIQVLVFLGLLGFLFYKNNKLFDKQYVLFCLSGIFLLILEIVLPSISQEYGLLRMFQQLLLFLAFPIVIATVLLTKFLSESKSLLISAFVAVLFFLTLTGFFSAVTGGYYPQMPISNGGMYYDTYFVNTQDVTGANWLAQNKSKQKYQLVQADIAGALQLLNYGNTYALEQIFPPLIRRGAYVFLTNGNLENKAIISINNDTYLYNSPQLFLDNHKNLIYNNGKVKIYK